MNNCSCSIEGYDSDVSTQFVNLKVVKAKKLHICGECGIEIQPGSKYEYASGMSDRCFFTAKTCQNCLSVRNAFFCSWIYGEIWSDLQYEIQEANGNLSQDCINQLTPKAKEKVLEMIDNYFEKVKEK